MAIKITSIGAGDPVVQALLHNKTEIAKLVYENLNVISLKAGTPEIANLKYTASTNNPIVHDIALVVEQLAISYSKSLEDPYTASDRIGFAFNKAHSDIAGIVIDATTLNLSKNIIDVVLIQEALQRAINKVLKDQVLIVEYTAISTTKPFSDATEILDSPRVLVDYKKHFQDYISISDYAGIDKYISSQKNTNAQIEDIFSASFSKKLIDSYELIDTCVVNTNKVYYELINTADNSYISSVKNFIDNAAVNDLVSLFIVYGKSPLFNGGLFNQSTFG